MCRVWGPVGYFCCACVRVLFVAYLNALFSPCSTARAVAAGGGFAAAGHHTAARERPLIQPAVDAHTTERSGLTQQNTLLTRTPATCTHVRAHASAGDTVKGFLRMSGPRTIHCLASKINPLLSDFIEWLHKVSVVGIRTPSQDYACVFVNSCGEAFGCAFFGARARCCVLTRRPQEQHLRKISFITVDYEVRPSDSGLSATHALHTDAPTDPPMRLSSHASPTQPTRLYLRTKLTPTGPPDPPTCPSTHPPTALTRTTTWT